MPDDFDDYFDGFDEDFDDDDSDGSADSDLDSYRNLPIYIRAMSISKLTRMIVDTFDEEKDQFQLKSQMMENAYILGAKIAGAEAADVYTLRMENAMLMKIHARELQAETSLCKAEKLCNQEYLQLLRDELEDFRKLLIGWVKSFDKLNDIEDEWNILF